jgi:hypothetical protein
MRIIYPAVSTVRKEITVIWKAFVPRSFRAMTPECRRSLPTWIEHGDMTGALAMPEREMAQTFLCAIGEGGYDFGDRRLHGTVFADDRGHLRIEGDLRRIEATDVLQT